MKTAAKICMAMLVGVCFSCPLQASAEEPGALKSDASISVGEKQKTETPAAVSSIASPPSLDGDKDKEKKEELPSPKVPDSVKGVIKRLNKTTNDVTLEDLNSAREAVAKLDILIDIEKRLTDLSKLRQEREEQSVAGAIPASALGMRAAQQAPVFTPPQGMQPSMQAMAAMPALPAGGKTEIQRIAGASGRYSALIKVGEETPVFVHEGDKLPDGSVVQNISNSGVTLLRGNSKHTIRVKNVVAVFNGR